MIISELIEHLKHTLIKHGDIVIEVRNGAGDFDTVDRVVVEPDSIHKDNTKFTAYID